LELNKHIFNLDKMLRRMIGEDVEFHYKFEDDLPSVQADPGMLDQVIMNLAVNSRDAMPQGGHLHIATEAMTFDESEAQRHLEARPGRFVCVSVSDTGTGIAPEHMAHVFEPFFTTKGVGKGTGLGLATVFGIVKQHSGWVEITSSVGVGTTFRIFLPALEFSTVASSPSQPKSDAQGGHEVILMVEDDVAVRQVNRRVLEQAGYRVLEASCGKEAIGVWARHSDEIELLLTDLMMPGGINGRDLAERLIVLRSNLKIIFMSGYNREILSGDTTILRRSQSRFLNKPCRRDELLRVIREQLDGTERPKKAATDQIEQLIDQKNDDRLALEQV
jgi:CheY-like chemotaxis protein